MQTEIEDCATLQMCKLECREILAERDIMLSCLLLYSDLEGLAKYYRRSPYDFGPKITVYLRSDVEAVYV